MAVSTHPPEELTPLDGSEPAVPSAQADPRSGLLERDGGSEAAIDDGGAAWSSGPSSMDPQRMALEAARARLGTRLNASWTLNEVLGSGGMGTVFAATHESGARAALKVLHLELARDTDLRRRFLRERKIFSHIDHPARVEILGDDVSDRGEPFLIMELLAGTTLKRLIRSAGSPLPLDQVLPVFDVVLDLLDRCHTAGVVHRDIKPANIFITGAGQVKVLDFGVARVRDPERLATQAGHTFGTPAFMSPEQALGLDNVDGRADLWSVGACIYAALSGELLHQGRTDAESYLLAATQPAPSLAHAAPHLPVEVVSFVDRALAPERGKRFQTAGAMRAELRGLLAANAAGRLIPGTALSCDAALALEGGSFDEGEPLRGAAADVARARLSSIWRLLEPALIRAREQGFSHPSVRDALEGAFADTTRALDVAPDAVRWEVGPDAFSFQGQAIWRPDRPPLDRVPRALYEDGLRKIQLKPGIPAQELEDLLAVLIRERAQGDDDVVTALWDRAFEHVAYLAMDAPLDEEPVTRPEDTGGPWSGPLEARAMERNVEEALKALSEGDLAPVAATQGRAALASQLAFSAEQWQDRFAAAFVDGYLNALRCGDQARMTSALTTWASREIAIAGYVSVLDLRAALCHAFAARAAIDVAVPLEACQGAVTAALLPPAALPAILDDLSARAAESGTIDTSIEGQADAETAGKAIENPADTEPRIGAINAALADPSIVDGIAVALDAAPGGALFAKVCACYGASASERLREALLAYMTRWSAGHEAEIAVLLPQAPLALGIALVGLLSGLRTKAAQAALEAGLESPYLDVRLSTMSALGAGDRAREEAQRLLDDPRPAARIEALRAIARLGVVVTGPALVRRVQAPDFHALSVDERRAWMEAVARLNPGRAERLAVEILGKRQLLPSDATEQTRALAAHTLVSVGRSHEALEAVKEATKPRWWNTAPVRDAAARAVPAIAARLASSQRSPSGRPVPIESARGGSRGSTVPPPSGRTSTIPPAPPTLEVREAPSGVRKP